MFVRYPYVNESAFGSYLFPTRNVFEQGVCLIFCVELEFNIHSTTLRSLQNIKKLQALNGIGCNRANRYSCSMYSYPNKN